MDYTYISIFVTLLILAYYYNISSENNKTIIQYVCLNFLTLFFGLHGNVGDDYSIYQSFYYNPTINEAVIYGPMYSLFSLMFSFFKLPFQCLIFLISIIANVLLVRFFAKINYNIPFGIAIFFSMGGIINEIDFIRSVLGLMLFVNSIEYISARNYKKYFTINFIGFLCHYSSILYFPFYWIGRKIINVHYLIVVFAVGLILAPLYIPISYFFPNIDGDNSVLYIEHAYKYLNHFQGIKIHFSFGTIERVTTAALLCIFYKKLIQDIYAKTAIWGFVFYFLCYTCLSNYAVLATRLANLYIFSYWILLPLFIKYITNIKIKVCYTFFLLLYMTFRLISISLMPQWNYQLCF